MDRPRAQGSEIYLGNSPGPAGLRLTRRPPKALRAEEFLGDHGRFAFSASFGAWQAVRPSAAEGGRPVHVITVLRYGQKDGPPNTPFFPVLVGLSGELTPRGEEFVEMLATRLADRRKNSSQSSDKAIARAKREVQSRISKCVALALAASVEDTLETGPVATIRRAQKHTHTMLNKRRRACTCDAAAHEGAFCVCSSDPPAPTRCSPGR